MLDSIYLEPKYLNRWYLFIHLIQLCMLNNFYSPAKLLSHVWFFATPWTVAHQASLSMGFSRQEYWSGLPFLSPGIFLTWGSNPDLQHYRQMLYHLSHQGSPGINWMQIINISIFIFFFNERLTFWVLKGHSVLKKCEIFEIGKNFTVYFTLEHLMLSNWPLRLSNSKGVC